MQFSSFFRLTPAFLDSDIPSTLFSNILTLVDVSEM
jgi:hypothetical protein